MLMLCWCCGSLCARDERVYMMMLKAHMNWCCAGINAGVERICVLVL